MELFDYEAGINNLAYLVYMQEQEQKQKQQPLATATDEEEENDEN